MTQDRGLFPGLSLSAEHSAPVDFIENLQLFHRLFLFFQWGYAIMLNISF